MAQSASARLLVEKGNHAFILLSIPLRTKHFDPFQHFLPIQRPYQKVFQY